MDIEIVVDPEVLFRCKVLIIRPIASHPKTILHSTAFSVAGLPGTIIRSTISDPARQASEMPNFRLVLYKVWEDQVL